MHLELIDGVFESKDALDIVTQMIQVKIRYHENKITGNSNPEDIKFRDNKIRKLQHELDHARKHISALDGKVNLHAKVDIAD